jgi:ferredoxin-NADP reductase
MTFSPAPAQPTLSPVQRLWRHPLWAPLNDVQAWNRLARVMNPAWSFTETTARVQRVVDEAPGVRSLWLRPNRRFAGFRPGQHLLLELEIDGARQARCFSFSRAPQADGLLRLTIKAKPGGPVSAAAHRLLPGQVLRLGAAQGEFAPRAADTPLLMLSAGSGITPIMALLQDLAARTPQRDVVLLHSARTEADTIFADELKALAAEFPGLRLQLHHTGERGHLDAARIAAAVPDWRERETLLCGPDGFMRTVEAMFETAGCRDRLQSESFGRRAAPIDPDAKEHAVVYGDTAHAFTARAGQTLLDAAEAAGLQPRFGCRRGICRTCQCRKLSGTVTNLLTGQASGPGEEWIQLCISTPDSAVELMP